MATRDTGGAVMSQDVSGGIATPLGGEEDRESFGEFLVSARQRAGRSLDEIARNTKVSKRYLDALERGRVELLPAGVYRRAIVRTYAASVRLDPSATLERFNRTFGAAAALSEWHGTSVTHTPRTTNPPARVDSPPVLSRSLYSLPRLPLRLKGMSRPALPRLVLPPRPLLATGTIIVAATLGTYIVTERGLVRRQPATVTAPLTDPSELSVRSTGTSGDARQNQVGVKDGTSSAPLVRPDDETSAAPQPAPGDDPSEQSSPAPAATVESRLVVTSNPAGARVTINGIGWGVTPVTIDYLPPGDKVIRVTKDGYVGTERRLNVGDGGTATVRLTLREKE